jgi:hypothetical protein
VIELGHAAVTTNHGLQHAHHGIRAEPMSLGNFFDQLLAGGGEFSHGDPLMVSPDTGLYKPQRCLLVPGGAYSARIAKIRRRGWGTVQCTGAIAAANFEVFASHVDRAC